MHDVPTTSPAVAPKPRPLGVIETDTFCDACGYNLNTQPVWRDERLGIPVCRCPECGGHQAAGKEVGASQPWLRRLATLGLLFWTAVSVGFVLASTLALGLMQVGSAELTTDVDHVAQSDGRPVRGTWTANQVYEWQDASGAVVKDVVSVTRWKWQAVTENYHYVSGTIATPTPGAPAPAPAAPAVVFVPQRVDWRELAFAFTCFSVLAAAFGAAMAVLSWHWRPRWRWIWALVAAVPLPITTWAYVDNYRGYYSASATAGADFSLGVTVVVMAAVGQAVLIAVGLWFGRPVARGVTRMFVPPKARQMLAFLWHADGKTMSPAKSAAVVTPRP